MLFSATYIPGHEFWANGAGWWSYHGVRKLVATLLYIILKELLIALVLPLTAKAVVGARLAVSVLAGLGVGLWIWGAYWVAFRLVA